MSNFLPTPKDSNIKYLDSWRFIAVTLVILSHLFHYPSNGFLGVDIFFLISGYVITKSLQESSASLKLFYKKRLIRILPPLFLLLLILIVISPLFYPEVAIFYRGEISSILGFFYNLRLLKLGSSYHGIGESTSSPLFHLWSISVEEQFYIFWPALYLFLMRLRKRPSFSSNKFLSLLFSLMLASLIFSLLTIKPSLYFNPLARTYELLAGCILYLLQDKISKNKWSVKFNLKIPYILSLLLLTLLILIPLPRQSMLVKYQTLALVILVCLIFTLESLLSLTKVHSLFSKIGKRSYGAYLYHLPLVILLNQSKANLYQKIFFLVILLLLVELSYQTLEKWSKVKFRSLSFAKVMALSIFTSIFILLLNIFYPLPAALPSSVDCMKFSILCSDNSGLSDSAESWHCKDGSSDNINSCYLYQKKQSDPLIMVLGDSVAKSFSPGITLYASTHNFKVYNQTINGCPWVVYGNLNLVIRGRPECARLAYSIQNNIIKLKPQYLILTYSMLNGTFSSKDQLKSLEFLSRYAKNIIILAPPPYIKESKCQLASFSSPMCDPFSKKELVNLNTEIQSSNLLLSQVRKVKYVNLFPRGCGNLDFNTCPKDGPLLRSANVHLTFFASFALIPQYDKIFLPQK